VRRTVIQGWKVKSFLCKVAVLLIHNYRLRDSAFENTSNKFRSINGRW
jgi:hypothetical protein